MTLSQSQSVALKIAGTISEHYLGYFELKIQGWGATRTNCYLVPKSGLSLGYRFARTLTALDAIDLTCELVYWEERDCVAIRILSDGTMENEETNQ